MFSSSGTSRSCSTSCASVTSGMVILLGWLGAALRLQIAVHEVDLLQPAQALADVLGADLTHAFDGLELGVCGREHLVEAAELLHDLLDHELGEPRDAAENPVAARRHRIVKGVELSVVAQELGEPTEVEQVLMRQPTDLLERSSEVLVLVLGESVVDERGLVGGGADHRLLELHLDETALGAE